MGLAFEIYDDISLNPTLEDIFHYAFAHSGILTGMYSRLDIDEFLCYVLKEWYHVYLQVRTIASAHFKTSIELLLPW